jgi:hypothetical protein
MKRSWYGAGWPSEIRILPQGVVLLPHEYSIRSAMSEGEQHVISAVRPISSPHWAVVVTMGSIPASAHMSMNSKGPNPLTSSEPHFAPRLGLSHGTPRHFFQK